MKICLISPPTAPEYGELAPLDELATLSEHAPLGVLSLAAVLEEFGMELSVIACNRLHYQYVQTRGNSPLQDFCEVATQKIAATNADFFGFSTICSSYPLTIRMASELRRLRPDARIVLGGPQASVVDQETLNAFPWVDFVVRGEAEENLPRLIEAISGTEHMEKVPGITFRLGNKIVRNMDAPPIQDLDRLPMPAFHHYMDLSVCRQVSLELGRGCPFSCTFCSTNDFFRRRFRLKSPSCMLQQMTALNAAYGIERFVLVHDMFTVDRKRVVEFCETLLGSGKRFRWTCSARTDCIDEDLIELMAQAGCSGIFFGIESGSPRLQTSIEKGLDIQEAARVIVLAHAHRIKTTVSMIIGFPEETTEDVRLTIDFLMNALRLDSVHAQLHLLAALAKTPLQIRYGSQLRLEEVSSDMCDLELDKDPRSFALIRSWPDVFSSFYSLPTKLNRRYLEELRAFLRGGMLQFRWLLLALHEHQGDIVTVFERWRQWCREQADTVNGQVDRRYYLGELFVQRFFQFLQSSYLIDPTQDDSAVQAMLDYEINWRQAATVVTQESAAECGANVNRVDNEVTWRSVPQLRRGVHLVPVTPKASKTILALRMRGGESIATQRAQECLCVFSLDGNRIHVLNLSPLAARLLQMCDGKSNVAEICSRFTTNTERIAGLETLTPEQVCIAGLESHAREGFIVFSVLLGNEEKDSSGVRPN